MTMLIGLSGRMRAGKDTAFEIIRDRWDPNSVVKRAAFADPLKISAARALGFDPADADEAVEICNQIKESGWIKTTYGSLEFQTTLTGREYLQRYGTEAHRDVFGQDFWVKATLPDDWQEKHGLPDILVITDVRFDNEAARILELGGVVFAINADDRLGPLPEDAHTSELGLKPGLVTRIISNNDHRKRFEYNLIGALMDVFV